MKNITLIEESNKILLDFYKLSSDIFSSACVLPVVIQNFNTHQVLMLGYINERALQKSISEKKVFLWSTSRNKLWCKGETSGNYLTLKEIFVNCEQNSLLFFVVPNKGVICHTKDKNNSYRKSCFYRKIKEGQLEFII